MKELKGLAISFVIGIPIVVVMVLLFVTHCDGAEWPSIHVQPQGGIHVQIRPTPQLTGMMGMTLVKWREWDAGVALFPTSFGATFGRRFHRLIPLDGYLSVGIELGKVRPAVTAGCGIKCKW